METVITASPHAFDPVAHHNLPPEEQEKVYSHRVNEIIRPYTVIDVLTKVYHRNFANDLSAYIGEHPKAFAGFKKSNALWKMSRVWVNECRCIRPESVFDQPKYAEKLKRKILLHGRTFNDRGDEKVSLYFYENEAEKLILLTSLYLSAFGNPAHDYFPEIGLTRKGSGSSRSAEQEHSQS